MTDDATTPDETPEVDPQEAPEAAAEEAPAAEVEAVEEEELIEEEEAPREKPAIPGADLEVDIVLEGHGDANKSDEEFDYYYEGDAAEADLVAEASEGEGDAEEAAADEPIADVTIDLAEGARYSATGKRKSAIARVILKPGTGQYLINGKDLDTYFPRETLRRNIRQALEVVGYDEQIDVVARIHGGGVSAQAGALRHGVSRALLVAQPNLRGELKKRGFLTRDSRVKERKKAGLKKARKRPQFSKR